MAKRLYKVYHLHKYNDVDEDSAIYVPGLGTAIFKPALGKKRNFFTARYNFNTYKVYSHKKDIELTFDDALLSIWKFDEEREHILLEKVVRKVFRGSNLAPKPLPKEDFQEYLGGLERLPDETLKKIENDEELSRKEVTLINKATKNGPALHGWTLEEVDEAKQMIDVKLGLYDAHQKQIQRVYADKRRKFLKRFLLVLLLLLFVGGGSFSFVQLRSRRSRTGKVTSSVTPTVKPVSETSSPSLIPTDSPIEATLIPSQEPTDEPTKLALLPSIAPTFHHTQTPTEQPVGVTLLPSKKPTQQPTLTPTNEPTSLTLLPSKKPTRQPTVTPTIKPTSLTLLPSKKPTQQPTRTPTRQPTQIPTRQPSTRPSPSPSKRPSSIPTLSPILPPTESPSLQQISRLNCEEIRKSEGATEGNLGKNNFEIEIIKENKYCGDTYGGKDPERPNRNKWSVRSGRRDCPTFSFEEGFNICDSVGARWCSVEELELLVGKGTGCGGDEQLIYSNSDCESESGLKGKIKFAPGSQAGKFPSYKCEIDLSAKSLVRCCGDV